MQVDPRLLKSQIWTMNEISTGSGSMSNQGALEDGVIQAHGSSQSLRVAPRAALHYGVRTMKLDQGSAR